jgi:hypothetical protein
MTNILSMNLAGHAARGKNLESNFQLNMAFSLYLTVNKD